MTDSSEPRIGDWIQTFTGKRFYPFDPRPEELDIRDIAHALSLICRWTGHCPWHYSVAQHCVLMADLAGRVGFSTKIQLLCLLHDAPEAYLCDVSRPVKRHEMMEFYRRAETNLLEAMTLKWMPDTHITMVTAETVKVLDDGMLMAEARLFWRHEVDTWADSDKRQSADVRIIPGDPKLWELRYSEAFHKTLNNERYTLRQREE